MAKTVDQQYRARMIAAIEAQGFDKKEARQQAGDLHSDVLRYLEEGGDPQRLRVAMGIIPQRGDSHEFHLWVAAALALKFLAEGSTALHNTELLVKMVRLAKT